MSDLPTFQCRHGECGGCGFLLHGFNYPPGYGKNIDRCPYCDIRMAYVGTARHVDRAKILARAGKAPHSI